MNRSHHREDRCPIDVPDPLECSVRESCKYWSRERRSCEYRQVKEREGRQRQAAVDQIRIDPYL